jgi:bifunctional UDP-N-acetylglucosamine pyrophosphorylase/glucosamine-1-phosphate N-acetyltransferase
MKSARPKVLHELAGRSIIEHVLGTVDGLRAAASVVVIGHGADQMREALASRPALQFVVQSPQLGTGHALMQAAPALKGKSGTALLVYGDVPLLQTNTLLRLLEHHRSRKAAATVLTMELPDPYGYGRIVRDKKGQIARIVEERDASAEQHQIREVNSGIYCFDLKPLFGALDQLAADNAQGEYYLTDLVSIYRQKKLRVETMELESPDELRGVNSRVDLAELGATIRARKNREVMFAGVTLEDPATTYIDTQVTIGADTTIGPGVVLQGKTTIGEGCRIHAGCRLTRRDDWRRRDDSGSFRSSWNRPRRQAQKSALCPTSGRSQKLRRTPTWAISSSSRRRSWGVDPRRIIWPISGDATIGENANIGAGTITCNYDGEKKHPTVIEDGAFIGSDSQLIAPVTIGKGAYVGAGSSISKDVPADALAVARARQENRPGWAAARRARRAKGHV